MGAERWMVAGLGNPEPEYAGTRHNIGAQVVREFARRHGTSLSRKRRVRGDVDEVDVGGARTVLFVPDAYMNRSGDPVRACQAWHRVAVERLVVCHDDLDIDLGTVRLKRGGGNAGHNGLRDVDRALGSPDYLRVRIGISRPPDRIPGRDHVLGRFRADETDRLVEAIDTAIHAISTLVTDGLEAAQQRHHGRPPRRPDTPEESAP
ncbi:MAG: aminoacyl-tRNA hydrolase [Nitriliruptoraceae bacterium]